MKTLFSVASVLMCAASLNAQVSATLNQSPDGASEIKVRNRSSVNLVAIAIGVKYTTQVSAENDPLTLYVDSEVDMFPSIRSAYAKEEVVMPLLPQQEFIVLPGRWMAINQKTGKPHFEQPVVAGIFADGTTTGNPVLLSRLMLRRSSMLLAVDTTLEALSNAGRKNTTRDQLIEQFENAVNSVRRWYLLPEQQIGLGLYQSMIGKLMHLPQGQVASAFLPINFVDQETATLRQQRLTLMKSQPSLNAISVM